MPFFYSPFTVVIVAILVGCVVVVTKTLAMTRVRELEIRERIAMIERGLVPPPESDPKGFERAMNRMERQRYDGPMAYGGRQRRVSVILVGVGLGLMVLISSAGNPRQAVGVGGFIAILGLAFFVSSLLERPRHGDTWNQPSAAVTPPAPPPNPSADLH